MPVVALLVIVIIAGCGTALLLVSRTRSDAPPRRRRRLKRYRSAEPDLVDPYSAWQFSEWAGPDAVALPSPSFGGGTQDDNACRAEPDSQFNYDLQRNDPPSFEVERDDSCSSDGGDSSDSDSSSSD